MKKFLDMLALSIIGLLTILLCITTIYAMYELPTPAVLFIFGLAILLWAMDRVIDIAQSKK